jgi:hypothetical protein
MAFEDNVFVNCPLDEDFYPLMRPLLFTIIYAGLSPRIALERLDSGEPRVNKIIGLISESKYAIHDLSRIKAKKAGEFFRLNMPFELGLDVGCRVFKDDHRSEKKCLILETERYRYQAAISDLSNSDIGVHRNEPKEVVVQVRNWLNGEANVSVPGPSRVWGAFNDFMAANYDTLKANGFSEDDIRRLPVGELIGEMRTWVEANNTTPASRRTRAGRS